MNRYWALACVAFVLLGAGAAKRALADAVTYGADEQRRILAHGPWPPPAARDPGNAQAGRRDAIALGELLFFDVRLSGDGRFACATCHQPALAFADGQRRSLGRGGVLDRNAPTLWNAVHERWYGWDGAADSLWSQAIRPIVDAREMSTTPAQVRALVAGDGELACRYRRTFGSAAATGADDEIVLVNAAKAIGAFVATLVSGRTPFDDFRDALARGDQAAMARYPASAQRGLKLFVGRGRCALCHTGPMFSHGEFGDTGLGFFVRPGVVDPGRHGGIAALRASRYNLLGRFSDSPADSADAIKTRHVEPQHRNFGEFKVPSLRNVALTAPYMHDGQLATLDDVLAHYSELNLERLHADGERILEPLHSSAGEKADLLAFLRTLSDPRAGAWQTESSLPKCEAAG
ncbi:MAG TPA: cytochrome c peroxidase [Burkholderiaceae bacterium]|nr:cytochrome c peroxidase [Burkholderiaceae bacterium]